MLQDVFQMKKDLIVEVYPGILYIHDNLYQVITIVFGVFTLHMRVPSLQHLTHTKEDMLQAYTLWLKNVAGCYSNENGLNSALHRCCR